MKKLIVLLYKGLRKTKFYINPFFSTLIAKLYFQLNGVKYGSIGATGIPHIHVTRRGVFVVGNNFTMGSWIGTSVTGLIGRCKIQVRDGAVLTIGNSVGMTLTTIICHEKITIGDNVNIGAGVHIYDTDFHSLNAEHRKDPKLDWANKKTRPIVIEKDVFIGAQSFILKGVTIGARSVIGAGSVVTTNIPPDVIAAGNPCKILRNINNEKS